MKMYCFIMLIIMTLLTVSIINGEELNNNLIGKVIVLDAGHGGVDKGSVVNNVYESDINLKIVLLLRDELIKQGVNVILTRDDDYDLSSPNVDRRKKSDFDNRINLINNSNADMYLSIHLNYLSESKYYGGQIFYTSGNERLASIMQKRFNTDLNSPRNIKLLDNSIYMYKKLKIPGILIECGFLSNDNERNLLNKEKYQKRIVKTIVRALIEYY